jgi:hypothetical protein
VGATSGAADVVLVTATTVSKQDFDEAPLLEALAGVGLTARVLAWDDPTARPGFAAARICVLRSTWNYVHHWTDFLAWVTWCAGVTSLWNPAAVVRWNSHKGYLFELAAAGIPIVPTHLVPRGTAVDLATLVSGWDSVVVKPAVSAGSFATLKADAADLAPAARHLSAMLSERDMLVQRYEPSVEDYGERSLVVIDGELSHAVRKSARFIGAPEAVSDDAVAIADDERALARAVLAAAPTPLLYARVDLVRDSAGRPQLMELELIEPSLFFGRHPPSAARMAAAIAARLAAP